MDKELYGKSSHHQTSPVVNLSRRSKDPENAILCIKRSKHMPAPGWILSAKRIDADKKQKHNRIGFLCCCSLRICFSNRNFDICKRKTNPSFFPSWLDFKRFQPKKKNWMKNPNSKHMCVSMHAHDLHTHTHNFCYWLFCSPIGQKEKKNICELQHTRK